MDKNKKIYSSVFLLFFLAMPASTNYKLKDFGFGTGGTTTATDGTYKMEAITGEVSEDQLSGADYDLGAGLIYTNQANVPPAPSFTNPSSYYNKLHITLAAGGNPSDAKFAIAISTDNFVSDTRYVQSDNTVGAALGAEDYQTLANWGGGSGEDIIGLSANTEYKVKVKAMQGNFTETGYGPIATASTVNPTMSFSIDTNTLNFGDLAAGAVADSPDVQVDFATNGENGGKVYVYAQNGGLLSSVTTYQINSATADLTPATEGFGAQSISATQTSGGPLTEAAFYDLNGNNVALVNSSIREIFSTANPIVGGQGTFTLKAKSSSVTPAAGDYGETLTVIASGNF
jgi:hypothetical protein